MNKSRLEMLDRDSDRIAEALPLLRRSISVGDQPESDVISRINDGSAKLWVVVSEEGTITSTVVTALQGDVLYVMHLAAEKFSMLEKHWPELEEYGRSNGARLMRGRCTQRAARFFSSAIDFRTIYSVVEKTLYPRGIT